MRIGPRLKSAVRQARQVTARRAALQHGADLPHHPVHLRAKLPRTGAPNAAAQRGKPDEVVRCDDPHRGVFADFVQQTLNVEVGALVLFCEHNAHPVVNVLLSGVAAHGVTVEHQDHIAACETVVADKLLGQRLPRRVQIVRCQRLQRVPRKNDIVAVHNDAFLPGAQHEPVGGLCRARRVADVHWPPDGAKFPLHDGFQLTLVDIQRRTARPHGRRWTCFRRREQVHITVGGVP